MVSEYSKLARKEYKYKACLRGEVDPLRIMQEIKNLPSKWYINN